MSSYLSCSGVATQSNGLFTKNNVLSHRKMYSRAVTLVLFGRPPSKYIS